MADGSDMEDNPAAGTSGRRRKTVWEARHKEALLRAFAQDPYPSFRAREELAREMGLPESRIRVWFQNRRTRSGLARRGSASAGPSLPADTQRAQEAGARARAGGRGGPAEGQGGRTRPRTRLSPQQLAILLEAFGRNPRPTYGARQVLAQRTALPEDTIHIWFQNRRARHPGTAGARTPAQDSPPRQPPTAASPAPHEDLHEGQGARDMEGAQDSLLPPAAVAAPAAAGVGIQTLTLTSVPSWPAAAQASGPGHDPEPQAVARNTCPPTQRFLDQLRAELLEAEANGLWRDTLDPADQWEHLEPTLTEPLPEEVYQALLQDLLL